MTNINPKEIESLVKLLDDPDMEVSGHVEGKLLSYGAEIIPYLETEWETSFDAIIQQKLENLIAKIQFDNVKQLLTEWMAGEGGDLLDGVFLISKYKYPDLDKQHIINMIDKIKLDVWLELHYSLTSLEKVKILNHVIYNLFGFSANVSHYHSPQNSYINNVLENRKGNPVSLSIVYQLVAQRLNIPIYGVNLPQHFVLAYRDDSGLETLGNINETVNFDNLGKGRILFYINAFNRGAILSLANLEQFVKQLNLEADENYFQPCSNIDMVKRMLRNLLFAYIQQNDRNRERDVREMLTILGEPQSDPGSGLDSDAENGAHEDDDNDL
jgi:regulator of sirC expression with transglutaminase-like and TPR domain